MRTSTRTAFIGVASLAAMLTLASPSIAQPGFGGPPGMRPKGERARFLKELFPPEMVMRHQTEIGLTDEQRDAITEAIKATQANVVEMQWQVESLQKTLGDMLAAPRVNEEEALAKASELMTSEEKIKKEHLALLIRIKNQLTPEQQDKLRELRPKRRPRRGPPE